MILTTDLILGLVQLVGGMIMKAYLSSQEVDAVFAKYQGQPVTMELLETIRKELIAKARRKDPLDDPEIRRLLEAGGTNPESLRT